MSVTCLCTNSSATKPFALAGTVDYVRCTNCGMIYRQHPETAVYDDAYFDPARFDRWAAVQDKLIPARLDTLGSLFPSTHKLRVLEVGGGRGSLLPCLIQRGWEWSVVEPSPAARTYLERTFAQPVFASLDEVPEATFDVIHLNHVLEHITDPVRALRIMRARLKPGGWLWLEVPQEIMAYRIARALRVLTGRDSFVQQCFDPAHAVLYTKKTVRLVLAAAGYTAIRVTWHGWCDPQRYAAFAPTLPPRHKALALLCRFSRLDWLLQGGWLTAQAARPAE